VIILCPSPTGEIVERTQKNGVGVYAFNDCPAGWVPDVVHANEELPSAYALMKWPRTAVVATVHSQFAVERPLLSSRIHAYICIRQEIIDHVKLNYHLPASQLHLIYNGFDFERFRKAKHSAHHGKRTILFVGTIDAIRRQSIEHLIEYTKKEHLTLRVVGKRYEDYLDNPPAHVEMLPPRWNVEELFTPDVVATAGVLLGRSTIEGWVAGLPGWIYDIDTEGNIKDVSLHPVPEDIDKFNIRNVTDAIVELYRDAMIHNNYDTEVYLGDMSAVASSLIDRSITQGMMIHELIAHCDYLEKTLSGQYEQINQLRDEYQHLQPHVNQLDKKIRTFESTSPAVVYGKLKRRFINKRKDT
jgi:glycosyltransferase involved in cell wall biosynthesis